MQQRAPNITMFIIANPQIMQMQTCTTVYSRVLAAECMYVQILADTFALFAHKRYITAHT